MRVTSQAYSAQLQRQLAALSTKQNELQIKAASGQRIQRPEDDPTAVQKVLDLQGEARSVQAYQKNIDQMLDYSNTAFGSIKALKQSADRAGEIATLADGTKSPVELATYAKEVDQMIEQAVQNSNAKFQGDYLFGGTKTSQPPFVATKDSSGRIISVAYQGNTSTASSEISEGLTASAQTLGSNTSGSGPSGLLKDSRNGTDLFQHLIDLRNNLESGNTAAIASTSLPDLTKDEDSFISHYGSVGALQSRLQSTKSILSNRTSGLQSQVSNEGDADIAQTLVELSQARNAYQVALQSGANIMKMSLMDYLR